MKTYSIFFDGKRVKQFQFRKALTAAEQRAIGLRWAEWEAVPIQGLEVRRTVTSRVRVIG